ncbi:HEPN domain-containing protein [sulfur-oxidizing endosymbiont of Gigantopelta aegis]|uniref:HEPN domain-containing protein n=1 Tax=sulfur-oxidizing endosymbiont of Gigantopelta aegis TaxID=2794934 RepID=UPI0018DD66C3|nr:HEPN domain-containing protein [sulfur-oxidizing endosymbiont of Gigantopelta aegis]
MTLSYQILKDRQRDEREHYPRNLGLRVHRALSWLNRAEQCEDDLDAEFIFLWIAYNAAYANEIDDHRRFTEQDTFQNFMNRLCEMDSQQKIDGLIWSEFAGSIRVLLDNKFVFQPFWDFQNKKLTENEWQTKFHDAKHCANKALGNKNTGKVLAVVFSRLYTLRNQLLHGGATWNSAVNREQMRDAVNFLKKLIPMIIEIMMDNHNAFWGEACYPVVEA